MHLDCYYDINRIMSIREQHPRHTEIAHSYPDVGAVLDLLKKGMDINQPSVNRINALFFSHVLYPDYTIISPDEVLPMAIQSVVEVVDLSKSNESKAASEAVLGNPLAARAALEVYGEPFAGFKEQVLGVAHLVAAVREGAGQGEEGVNLYALRGRSKDHLNAGVIYLSKAIALKKTSGGISS